MVKLHESIMVQAPIERCFALSTSLAVVRLTLKMEPVAGRTSGCVEAEDTVRWEGRKFGFRQYHVSVIDRFVAPEYFRDRMLEGRFASFEHEHWFRETALGTMLEDEVRYLLPFGPLNWIVAGCVMTPHIRRLMRERFALLKKLAEGDGWREYVDA